MNLQKLKYLVSDRFGVDITSKCRDTDHFLARAVFFEIAYNKYKFGSLQAIGDYVNRNHATVLHGITKVFPHIKTYYPRHYDVYISIMKELFVDVDLNIDDTAEERLLKVSEKYNDIVEKYNELLSKHNNSSGEFDDKESLIDSIRRVPDDKIPTLKLRVDAIIKMI